MHPAEVVLLLLAGIAVGVMWPRRLLWDVRRLLAERRARRARYRDVRKRLDARRSR